MRRHLSYANVAATLALVFAMSGSAIAAKHYLIESAKQINPKVLKKLRGPSGSKGATGSTGAPGAPGAPGKDGTRGPAGPLTTALPSGQTLRGNFAGRAFGKPNQDMQIPISFGFELAAAPAAHYLVFGSPSTPECPGTAAEPTAAPGNLCVYESETAINAEAMREFDPVGGVNGVANRFGGGVAATAKAEGDFRVRGSWAVTAP